MWLESPAFVFLCGSAMACVSLVLACLVPPRPGPGREVAFRHSDAVAAAKPAATESPGV